MPGKCKFNPKWCKDTSIAKIQKWLREDPNSTANAICIACKATFNVEHSGIAAVRKHAGGAKHIALTNDNQTTLNYLQECPKTSTIISAIDAPSEIIPTSQNSIEIPAARLSSYMLSEGAMRAEIMWAIDRVMQHLSLRDGEEASSLFPLMFPDSEIASKFQMKKDKLAYIATYGIGPYFQNRLSREVALCPFFCVSFDESLNKVAQKGQMDLIVRYWDSIKDEVATRYLTSTFLGHARARDLLEAFKSSITDLGLRCDRIIQISMDGPNVNLAFLKDFESSLNIDNTSNSLIDIGTCSLHIVHGAYKYAHKKTNWQINIFLRVAYNLFKNFPCRRADYTYFSKSSVFPKKMCSIRWVENAEVIKRAIEVIPNLKQYVEGVKKAAPDSNNFTQVIKFIDDAFLLAKLQFMLTVTTELEPFLRFFQCNKPLLPFLYADLMSMLKNIMKRFIISKVIDSAKSGSVLIEIDLKEKTNYIPIHKIDIGFGARAQLSGKNERDVLIFKRDCRDFLVILCERLSIKSPLRKKFVKGISCLSPDVMLSEVLSQSRIKILLGEFVRCNQISAVHAENIQRDYNRFCSNENVRTSLKTFQKLKNRLDLTLMSNIKQFSADDTILKQFFERCLVLFHGNADVERGFSINSNCLVENLMEDSLIAQRSIISAVSAIGGVKNLVLDKALISSVRHASQKRKDALESKQKQQTKEDNSARDDAIRLKMLVEKKKRLLETAKEESHSLSIEIDQLKKKPRLN